MKGGLVAGLVLSLCAGVVAVSGQAQAEQSQVRSYDGTTIWRLALPVRQEKAVLIPTTPEEPTFIELPYAVTDWLGRGFATNLDTQGADFHLRLRKGDAYFGVTPLVTGGRRVLHLVMAGNRSLTLEFLPAPERGSAFRAVVFYDSAAEDALQREAERREAEPAPMEIERADAPPESRYTPATTETQAGLTRFMQFIHQMPEASVAKLGAQNPALQIVKFPSQSQPGDGFTLIPRFAVRDSVTDSLGIAVAVKNETNERLALDPNGWVVRAGAMVYPVGSTFGTVLFPPALGPNATEVAYIVLTRGPDGAPTRLMPDNDFRITARVVARAVDNPVFSVDLPAALTPAKKP